MIILDPITHISVCALRGVKDSTRDMVVKTINNKMIREFEFPLEAEGCPSIEKEIESIISNNLVDYKNKTTIDAKNVCRDLNKISDASKEQAFVIIIDKKQYGPLRTDDDKQPGIYGVEYGGRLVILRYTHEEAIRHEVGHMFGLKQHDENPKCVMNYKCCPSTPHLQFCNECKNKLKDIWEKKLKGKH